MNTSFRRNFWVISAWHTALVVVIFVVPLLWGLFHTRRPPEVMYVTLATPAPPAAEMPVDTPAPDPAPEPAPETPPPPPPERTKTPIVVNEDRVRNPRTPTPTKPRLTQEQIERELNQGAPQGPVTRADLPSWFYAKVRAKMYAAWDQPGELSGLTGITAVVTIRIERDGRVSRCRMEEGSGNALMDRSVLAGARSVTFIEALPSSCKGPHKDLSVEFELTP